MSSAGVVRTQSPRLRSRRMAIRLPRGKHSKTLSTAYSSIFASSTSITGMSSRIGLHAPVFSFDLHPVLGGFFQRGKPEQGSGSTADPWPQLFPDFAQAQALAVLHEIHD